ncbi:MAG: hypothetical protein R3C25_05710 [Hyphomonadaceae bacterium]
MTSSRLPPAEFSSCATCEKRVALFVCSALGPDDCPAAMGDIWGADTKHLKLVKAVGLIEAAIVAIGVEAGGLKAMDDLLDVVRELEALLEANTAIAQSRVSAA